jgi:hypothetical protein
MLECPSRDCWKSRNKNTRSSVWVMHNHNYCLTACLLCRTDVMAWCFFVPPSHPCNVIM